jgi:AbrB family looped-hinge helix DNA binding protein
MSGGITLFEEERKIGPKGQVVIPQAIRKALKMQAGTNVVVSLEDNKVVVKKPSFDAVAVFIKAAKQIHYNNEIDPHEAYEKSLEARTRYALHRR